MTDTMTEAVTTTAFEVGRRYRVNTRNPEGAQVDVGQTVQCVRSDGGAARFQVVNEHDVPDGREWIIYRNHLDDLPVAAPDERDATIEALRSRIAEMETTHAAERARAATFRTAAINDADIISTVLIEEAEARDWCGDYDAIITKINGRLSVLSLNDREVEYDVTWQETYTVTVTRTSSFTGVRGDSDGNSERAEEARDNSEELNEYDLIQHLRDNGSHSFDDYVDDSLEWEQS